MSRALPFIAIVFTASIPSTSALEVTPIGKVLQLWTDLAAKIIGEGEAAQKAYVEYSRENERLDVS